MSNTNKERMKQRKENKTRLIGLTTKRPCSRAVSDCLFFFFFFYVQTPRAR